MSDTISREKAYEVLSEYYHHKTEIQHKALRVALDMVPSADIDLSDYSDRLWRNAYEQGKAVSKEALDEAYAHGYTTAEADFHKKNQWIPVTERLPKPNETVGRVLKHYLVQDIYGDMLVGIWDGVNWQMSCSIEVIDDVVAWMPLPKPYKEGE